MGLRPGATGRHYQLNAFDPNNERAWRSQRGKILIVLKSTDPCGWLAREMGYKIGTTHNQANTRLGELRSLGLVQWNGTERETADRGHLAHEFALTPEGRHLFAYRNIANS